MRRSLAVSALVLIPSAFIACDDDAPLTRLQFAELVGDRVEESHPGVVVSGIDERGFYYSRGDEHKRLQIAEEYVYYTRNPDELDGLVDRLASLVEPRDLPLKTGADQEHLLRSIMPVLKPPPFQSEAEARAEGQPLLMGEHSTGLLIFYVIDQPTSMSFLTADSLRGLGLSFRQLTDLSLTNLYRRTGPDRYLVERTIDGPIVRGDTRDGYDATRLISPVLLETLSRLLDTSSIDVAIPRRDLLLAIPSGEPNLHYRLREMAQAEYTSGPHSITSDIFRVDRQGVQRLDSQEERPEGG